MSKKVTNIVGVILDWAAIVFGAFLFLFHFFKIVPGFGSPLALAVTVVIAYLGPIGLIMVVLGVANLLKDRLSGPEEDEADDYYGEGNDTRDF